MYIYIYTYTYIDLYTHIYQTADLQKERAEQQGRSRTSC